MRARLLGLVSCVWLGLGCSAADPGNPTQGQSGGGQSGGGSGGAAAGGGSAGQSSGGASTNAGAGGASAGKAGGGGDGGGQSNGGGGVGGVGGSGGGGTAGSTACAPDLSGAPSVIDDTVHDPKTCLDWMKTTQSGVNYAAAETYCADATTGGFDDWRIPSASELASIVTLCGKYPPEGPIDTKLFDLQGDGYWTTTSAGEPNKVCAIGMLNAGGYYHYGTAGPQVVRCVRGTGTVATVADCTTAQGCMNW